MDNPNPQLTYIATHYSNISSLFVYTVLVHCASILLMTRTAARQHETG
jgi:hypothetical protein